jgi:hypothetical protein
LETVHGSHLYGLSHTGSDRDTFYVYGYDKFKPRQKVCGGEDNLVASYDSFMRYCDKGVPQYLEAMWSRQAVLDRMPFDRLRYRPTMALARETYVRTVKSFWLTGLDNDDRKRRRHAVRLALNLRSMEETGLFDPTLTDAEREYANKMCDYTHLDYKELLDA